MKKAENAGPIVEPSITNGFGDPDTDSKMRDAVRRKQRKQLKNATKKKRIRALKRKAKRRSR